MKDSKPTEIFGVPVDEEDRCEDHAESDAEDATQRDGLPFDVDVCGHGDVDGFEEPARDEAKEQGSYTSAPEAMCSQLPTCVDLIDFLGYPVNMEKKSKQG
eukprot:12416693-Karenia_brevis.AAC.2